MTSRHCRHSSSPSSRNRLPLNWTQFLILSIFGNPFHHSFTGISFLPSFLITLTSAQEWPISPIRTQGLSGVTLSGTQAITMRGESDDLSSQAVPGRWSFIVRLEGTEVVCLKSRNWNLAPRSSDHKGDYESAGLSRGDSLDGRRRDVVDPVPRRSARATGCGLSLCRSSARAS